MQTLSSMSDFDLLARMPNLVLAERAAAADVIEHLLEIDRRKLYLEQACSSLYAYCVQRLGYSEDEALRRVRVARLAHWLPNALEELRTGAIHLTGLFVISQHLTLENSEALLAEARGKSRRELKQLLARWFPRPDVEQRIEPLIDALMGLAPAKSNGSGPIPARTCTGPGGTEAPFKLDPLSASSYRVEFTASAELYAKIEKTRQMLSHALTMDDLASLFERALDVLIEQETKRRMGAGRPRKRRTLSAGSRHIPVEVRRAVWERDAGQCTFADSAGRRCSERRFLTLEHRQPFAMGGPPTVENLCLLCKAHNAYTARHVFGEAHIAKKREEARQYRKRAKRGKRNCEDPRQMDVFAKVSSALGNMGFRRHEVTRALAELREVQIEPELETLLRAALARLGPDC
jgi:hypothetical protein